MACTCGAMAKPKKKPLKSKNNVNKKVKKPGAKKVKANIAKRIKKK